MSAKRRGKAVIRRNGHSSRNKFLSDATFKEFDAQRRLGDSFCMFIKIKDGQYRFWFLTNTMPGVLNFKRCMIVILGSSNIDVGIASDEIKSLRSRISEIYSEREFHPTVALNFLSRYLRNSVEEFWLLRSLAVEFMIFDPMFEFLHIVRMNGDFTSCSLGESTETAYLIGAYNKSLRKKLFAEIQAHIGDSDLDEQIKKFGSKIGKKHKLSCFLLVKPEILSTTDGGQSSDDAKLPKEGENS